MPVDTEGASGPQGNAAPGNASDALDKAINAAMGGHTDGDDIPPQLVKAKMEENARKDSERKDIAGDDRNREDAGKPADKGGEAPEAPAAEAVSAAIEAPNHWPAERKQAFAAFKDHPEIQRTMLAMAKDLEGGFTRKSQELSDQAKFAESVRGLFDDADRRLMTQAGLDEVGTIRYHNQLARFASQRPVEYIGWAMQQLGVRPEHLGFSSPQQRQTAQPQQPPAQAPRSTGDPQLDALLADPETAKLRSEFGQFSQAALGEINALKQYIAHQEHQKQEYARQQQAQGVQSIRNQWNSFRSAQDDHGQLAYPHADALMQPMGALMDSHPVLKGMPDGPDKLAKAYQMALAADPELSKPIFEAELAKRLATQQKTADAEKAKKAAAVRPATGAPTLPAKKGGLDAALDGAMTTIGWKD